MPPETPARPRPIWSGTLTFGLVSVPVNLYPGQRGRRPSLRMLAPDGTPLSRRYFCPAENRELSPDEIVRGFEHAPGEFVLISDEELESVEPEKSRDIDLRVFVPREQVRPLRFERPYVLTPAGESTKPYRLLARTMERSGRAGIATFVMRDKEYLVAIAAEAGVLRAETLRFDDELRAPDDVGLPEREDPEVSRVKAMRAAMRDVEADELDTSELEDDESERLRELVRRKGRRVRAPEPEVEEGAPARILDLVAVLKRQLQEGAAADETPGEDGEASAPARRARGSGKARKKERRAGSRRSEHVSESLAEQTREQLYERARELEIPGRSSMSKRELIEALSERDER